ncbi:MAG: hypothetical protein EBX40_08940, partial [Gammaproteobacteria bacterium]|nr:hypothetical protein [Gammaproteobacteria bacterium]
FEFDCELPPGKERFPGRCDVNSCVACDACKPDRKPDYAPLTCRARAVLIRVVRETKWTGERWDSAQARYVPWVAGQRFEENGVFGGAYGSWTLQVCADNAPPNQGDANPACLPLVIGNRVTEFITDGDCRIGISNSDSMDEWVCGQSGDVRNVSCTYDITNDYGEFKIATFTDRETWTLICGVDMTMQQKCCTQ